MPRWEELQLERAIANAHRWLYQAQTHAEVLNAWGLAQDIRELGVELARVGDDLITRQSPQKIRMLVNLRKTVV